MKPRCVLRVIVTEIKQQYLAIGSQRYSSQFVNWLISKGSASLGVVRYWRCAQVWCGPALIWGLI